MKTAPALRVGYKVKFSEEKQRYTVRGVTSDGRFAVCTKPMNLYHTVLYSIIDFESGVRGPDDLVFSFGYETDDQIAKALAWLEAGDVGVSRRRCAVLNIESVWDDTGAAVNG